jgi:hypothetical protein
LFHTILHRFLGFTVVSYHIAPFCGIHGCFLPFRAVFWDSLLFCTIPRRFLGFTVVSYHSAPFSGIHGCFVRFPVASQGSPSTGTRVCGLSIAQRFHSLFDVTFDFYILIIFHTTVPKYVRFEVFTAVTMKNGVFYYVTPCGSCKNRRFGGTYRLHHQGDKNR